MFHLAIALDLSNVLSGSFSGYAVQKVLTLCLLEEKLELTESGDGRNGQMPGISTRCRCAQSPGANGKCL